MNPLITGVNSVTYIKLDMWITTADSKKTSIKSQTLLFDRGFLLFYGYKEKFLKNINDGTGGYGSWP